MINKKLQIQNYWDKKTKASKKLKTAENLRRQHITQQRGKMELQKTQFCAYHKAVLIKCESACKQCMKFTVGMECGVVVYNEKFSTFSETFPTLEIKKRLIVALGVAVKS